MYVCQMGEDGWKGLLMDMVHVGQPKISHNLELCFNLRFILFYFIFLRLKFNSMVKV